MSSIQARNINHPDYSENLNSEKYEIIRSAILAVLPTLTSGDSMEFSELEEKIQTHLQEKQVSPALFPKDGSVRWYTKAVQLDLEARGEIERLPNQSPLRLRKK